MEKTVLVAFVEHFGNDGVDTVLLIRIRWAQDVLF